MERFGISFVSSQSLIFFPMKNKENTSRHFAKIRRWNFWMTQNLPIGVFCGSKMVELFGRVSSESCTPSTGLKFAAIVPIIFAVVLSSETKEWGSCPGSCYIHWNPPDWSAFGSSRVPVWARSHCLQFQGTYLKKIRDLSAESVQSL